ncbi:sulfate transporter 3 [Prunus dulcis]|uniref:Sulfate transporter 3 n=1 Tax=Prunus dulcis TaxID=3755 RepID=A0A4Y1RHS8_PRUDU|nr:sulfate transporter 3 [Prunus dulcis]
MSNKEIFLCELISNASDVEILEKVQFTGKTLLKIRQKASCPYFFLGKEAIVLVSGPGIGEMSKIPQDSFRVLRNLGRVLS